MALSVDIEKRLGAFQLNVKFEAGDEVARPARRLRLRQKHDAEVHRRHRKAG